MIHEEEIEGWRSEWRRFLVPCLHTPELEALRDGLQRNDPRLCQKRTVVGTPGAPEGQPAPPAKACGIAYALWQGSGLETAGEVEEAFLALCARAEAQADLDDPAGLFVNWFDCERWDIVRAELLAEVNRALAGRKGRSRGILAAGVA